MRTSAGAALLERLPRRVSRSLASAPLPVCGLFLLLLGAPLSAQITEYSVGFNGLVGIAAGPDGAIWFSGNNHVGRVTTAGVVTSWQTTTNSTCYSITAGPDNAMWFTETRLNSSGANFANIGRIAMDGTITRFALADGSIPNAITNGPDGALWFLESGNGKVGRISTSGSITEFNLPASEQAFGVFSITAGPDGALWMTEDYGADKIVRMTTSGTFTVYPVVAFANAGSTSITVGPDGALWFADQNSKIGRITTSGAISTFPLATGDAGYGIAKGPDGALWYTSFTGGIGRITTSGTLSPLVPTPTNTAGGFLGNIVAGSDGAMWFTEAGGKIGRIPTGVTVATPSISLVANAEGDAPLIAPNTWVEIKGTALSPANDTRIWQASDFPSNVMPTNLDGVSVTVNGKAAYVYYISPTQINILTPPDTLPALPSVVVTNNGTSSTGFFVPAQATSPSFFVFNGGPYVAAVHANGGLIGPPTLFTGATTPAKPGEIILVYANGFGPTTVPVVTGAVTQSGDLVPQPVIKINGTQVDVKFAGLVFPGEYQFNIVVPAGLAAGDYSITATLNGSTTQAGTLLTVQP